MQRLWHYAQSVEEYQARQVYQRVRPEPCCPRCGTANGLRAHAYYWRWIVSWVGAVVALCIRRFRCRVCQKTVSYLPVFAQPYRLLCSALIGAALAGAPAGPAGPRWQDRWRAYGRRFVEWLPYLRREVGCALGPAPPGRRPRRRGGG